MASFPTGASRVPLPPSGLSGPLYTYLTQVALALNSIPTFSVTSYGNPNSNVTGGVGDMLANLGAKSSATAVTWVKEQGSGNTGWASLLTAQSSSSATNVSTGSFANPNGVVTGVVGDVVFNRAAQSQATAVAWVKEIGSGNTGWMSLLTASTFSSSLASYGAAVLGSVGSVGVSFSAVTTSTLIFVSGMDGTTNIGNPYCSGRVNGSKFTISSTNILDSGRTVAWMAVQS